MSAPLLVINGKPRLYRHFEYYVCKVEVPPTGSYHTYQPGEPYCIVWLRNTGRLIVHGTPVRSLRASGRPVYRISGPEFVV